VSLRIGYLDLHSTHTVQGIVSDRTVVCVLLFQVACLERHTSWVNSVAFVPQTASPSPVAGASAGTSTSTGRLRFASVGDDRNTFLWEVVWQEPWERVEVGLVWAARSSLQVRGLCAVVRR
jgi:hypothetical protein